MKYRIGDLVKYKFNMGDGDIGLGFGLIREISEVETINGTVKTYSTSSDRCILRKDIIGKFEEVKE
jgi:hypothetical protein